MKQFLIQIFEWPHHLLWIPIAGIIFGLFIYLVLKLAASLEQPWLERFGRPVHIPRTRKSKTAWPFTFQFLALTLALIAWARPQWGQSIETATDRALDLVIAVDVSLSMNAEDLTPNRLERAKASINKLLERLGPDRVSLIAFAGEAYTLLPFTPDHGAVTLYLNTLDPSTVTHQGTSLDSVADEVLRLFKDSGDDSSSQDKVLMIYTDGEDTDTAGVNKLKKLRALGIRVFAIGCGTTKGVPIPVRDARGTLTDYKKQGGQIVTSRLNEELLQSIAQAGEGAYLVITEGADEITPILNFLKGLNRSEKKTENRIRREDRFAFFLGASCILWCLSFLPLLRSLVPLGILLFSVHATAADLPSYLENRKGIRSYSTEQFDEAEKQFLSSSEQADTEQGKNGALYNLGRTLESKGSKEDAAKAYSQSAQSSNLELKARSLFARGNLAAQNQQWEEALRDYSNALQALDGLSSKPQWADDLANNIALALRKKDDDQNKDQDSKNSEQTKQDNKSQQQSQKQDKDDSAQQPPEEKKQPQEPQKQDPQKQPAQKTPNHFESEELSPEDAKQVLRALLESEKKSLKEYIQRQQKKTTPTRPEKDW